MTKELKQVIAMFAKLSFNTFDPHFLTGRDNRFHRQNMIKTLTGKKPLMIHSTYENLRIAMMNHASQADLSWLSIAAQNKIIQEWAKGLYGEIKKNEVGD